MSKRSLALSAGLLGLSLVFAGAAGAAEYPIGKPVQQGGMEVGAVYLQPIEMDPPNVMRAAKDSDIHLEADIHAIADNKTGFPEGEWMPYLVVHYELQKAGSANVVKGMLMPMVANDGPHYGDNVKLEGPGKYHLKLSVQPPTAEPMNHFGRHIDKETGVGPWFEPLNLDYDFAFAGTGKKGGY
ncbi:MAG TPA: iron transporter [Bordetella sp.]